MSSDCRKNGCGCSAANVPQSPRPEPETELNADNGVTTRYRITDMDCPAEEAMIRSALKGRKEVLGLDFNLLERVLTVHHWSGRVTVMVLLLNGIGFEPHLMYEESNVQPGKDQAVQRKSG